MTARPGRVKQSVTVDFPRPRSLDLTASPEFNQMKRHIRDLIRDEAIRAELG
jgi:NitT/TauT family transport system ATP-binding protein